MFKSYLQSAFRNLWRYRFFTAINIVGLALSMSVCMLTILYILDHQALDRFHEKSNQIFRVTSYDVSSEETTIPEPYASTPVDLAEIIGATLPGVDKTTRVSLLNGTADFESLHARVNGLFVEPSFFDLFSFSLEHLDPQSALIQPYSVVLSHKTVRTLFGDRDPIGKTITIEKVGDLTVTGVLEDPPGRTHFPTDVLVSFNTLQVLRNAPKDPVNSVSLPTLTYTYVLLHPGTQSQIIDSGLAQLAKTYHRNEHSESVHKIQSLGKIGVEKTQGDFVQPRLDGSIYFFAGLALILMITALFNYIGLSIARALKRTREIGVRKVVGAHQNQIMAQFLLESIVVAFAALVLAWIILFWLKASFNNLSFIRNSGSGITLDFVRDAGTYGYFLAFAVLVGLVAGMYPALYLSRLQPLRVLKGVVKGHSGIRLRKSLIGIQFGVSLILITVTALFFRQAKHMVEANYGFNQELIINVDLQGVPAERLRNAFSTSPHVSAISFSNDVPVAGCTHFVYTWSDSAGMRLPFRSLGIDETFLTNLEIPIIAGRNFDPIRSTDASDAVILNESAVADLGFKSATEAIGQIINLDSEPSQRQVIGVTSKFAVTDIAEPIGPVLMRYTPDEFRYANIRLRPGNTATAVDQLTRKWHSLDPTQSFSFHFFDDQIEASYLVYRDAASVIGFISFFALLIAALGLLGMASYAMELRMKEVGLRKVLGATASNLVLFLSRDFLKIVVIASAVALPLSLIINNLWLNQFAVRISLDAWTFILGFILMIGVAFLTISTQTLHAARTNPIDILRYE